MPHNAVQANDIPCHEMYVDDYNYSSEWGNKLINIWIEARRNFRQSPTSVEAFRTGLRLAILEEIDLQDAFLEGCKSLGFEGDLDSELFQQYEACQELDVMQLVPSGLHAEMCWIPGWDERDLDDLMGEFGLRSDRWYSSCIEDVQPGKWLETFLKMVNCSSVDLIAAAKANSAKGRFFAEKCAKSKFKVAKDQNRYQLLTPNEVIAAIENAYSLALPMFHWEINVRALFEMDPTRPMMLTTDKSEKVHVGFHDPILNGAGYLDTYKGQVVVPPDASGFLGASRMRWSVNETYGLYRPAVFATPTQINQ